MSRTPRSFDSPELPRRACLGDRFLVPSRLPERGTGGDDMASHLGGLTFLMVRETGCSFRRSSLSCHRPTRSVDPDPLLPGELPSPKRRLSRRTSPTPSLPRALSAEPYRPLLPGWRIPLSAVPCRDDVGLSSVTVVSHFVQVMPSQTLLRPAVRNRVPRCGATFGGRQGFITVRSLARRTSRNATPPVLSLPGPFNAPRCQATLAAYPLRLLGTVTAGLRCPWRGSSKEFRTGSDPHG